VLSAAVLAGVASCTSHVTGGTSILTPGPSDRYRSPDSSISRAVGNTERERLGCARVHASVAEQAAINAEASGSPTVAIIGDSYVAGSGATDAQHGWAYLLARQEGWRGILLGVGGSGLQNDGPCNGQTYLDRVGATAAVAPAAVIVEGGLNDRDASAETEASLLRQLVAALRVRIPGVAIALVGPPAPEPSDAPDVSKISGAFRDAAAATGVRLVDPYTENWFTAANRPALIAPDDIHPNDRGHAYFARRVAQDLSGWP
jgi:lysophospholipase L1-like esterase